MDIINHHKVLYYLTNFDDIPIFNFSLYVGTVTVTADHKRITSNANF